jgi:hypothetical protein
MIQYNVTVIIEPEIHLDWVQWMKEVHIPEVMATGCFLQNNLSRLLQPDDGNITYSVQYICRDMDTYQKYQQQFAPALQKDHAQRYEGKFVAFRTVLKIEYQSGK